MFTLLKPYSNVNKLLHYCERKYLLLGGQSAQWHTWNVYCECTAHLSTVCQWKLCKCLLSSTTCYSLAVLPGALCVLYTCSLSTVHEYWRNPFVALTPPLSACSSSVPIHESWMYINIHTCVSVWLRPCWEAPHGQHMYVLLKVLDMG